MLLKELYYFLSGKEHDNKIIYSIDFNTINQTTTKQLISQNIFYDSQGGYYSFKSNNILNTTAVLNRPFANDYTYKLILNELT